LNQWTTSAQFVTNETRIADSSKEGPMSITTIWLLASKIAALDAEAQHAVEIAVDSLLVGAGFGPRIEIDARFAELERRLNAIVDHHPDDETITLDEHACHQPGLIAAIEHLKNAAQRTLDELRRADAAYA
jgi:hypothetical protein